MEFWRMRKSKVNSISYLLKYGEEELKGISDTPTLDAQIILENILKKDKLFFIMNKGMGIDEKECNEFKRMISVRKSGVPVQYIVKEQEFMGFDFYVDRNVLIPRQDTEILVEEVLNLLKEFENPYVLDIGSGSGAISVSLAKLHESVEIIAVDISSEALEVATLNSRKNEVSNRIKIICSNLFSNIGDECLEKFDIIVSNPPYIPREDIKELQIEVQKEPVIALDGGIDGLDFYKKIIKEGFKYISCGGYLAFEIGYGQSFEIKKLMAENGYVDIRMVKDLRGINRVLIGRKI
jgi:release factor glutamine methyltransferase